MQIQTIPNAISIIKRDGGWGKEKAKRLLVEIVGDDKLDRGKLQTIRRVVDDFPRLWRGR